MYVYITDIGDLLFFIMTEYSDIDVQDKARFYYALMTGAADKKVLFWKIFGTYRTNSMYWDR